jgi:nitroreductase
MEAINALLQRVSCGKLTEPAPTLGAREAIFSAALRAADHGNLRPWRFLVIEGGARTSLGEVFSAAALDDDSDLDEAQLERYKKMPTRAPLLVVAVAQTSQHPKVPQIEQIVAAGAAVQNMLNAAFALGVGAYWRTGPMAYHPRVIKDLGLLEGESVVGFLYLGTAVGKLKPLPALAVADYFEDWPG